MNEFFRTMMGRTFFDLLQQLSRLNDNLETMNVQQKAMFESAKERDAIEDARIARYDLDEVPVVVDMKVCPECRGGRKVMYLGNIHDCGTCMGTGHRNSANPT